MPIYITLLVICSVLLCTTAHSKTVVADEGTGTLAACSWSTSLATAELPLRSQVRTQTSPSLAITATIGVGVLVSDEGGYATVYLQQFDPSNGQAVNLPVLVTNAVVDVSIGNPKIVALVTREFITIWHQKSATEDMNGFAVMAQRLTSAGTLREGPFLVNTYVAGDQDLPEIASLDSGWIAAYRSDGGLAYSTFDLLSNKISEFFVLPARSSHIVESISLSAFANTLQLVYSACCVVDSSTEIFATTIQDGIMTYSPVMVNEVTSGSQIQPSVAWLAVRQFAIVWQTKPLLDYDIAIAVVDVKGNIVRAETTLVAAVGDQTYPRLATLRSGLNLVLGFVDTGTAYFMMMDRQFQFGISHAFTGGSKLAVTSLPSSNTYYGAWDADTNCFNNMFIETPSGCPPEVIQPVGNIVLSPPQAFSFSTEPVFASCAVSALSLSAANLPAWATFDPSSSMLTLSPPAGAIGTTTIVLTASDGSLATSYAFSVQLDNNPVCPAVPAVFVGTSTQFVVNVSRFWPLDPEGRSYTTAVIAAPPWISLNLTSRILSGITPSVPQLYSIVIRNSDSGPANNVVDCAIPLNVQLPPALAVAPSIVAAAGRFMSYCLPDGTFADPRGTPVTYTFVSLPNWLVQSGACINGNVPVGAATFVIHCIATGNTGIQLVYPTAVTIVLPPMNSVLMPGEVVVTVGTLRVVSFAGAFWSTLPLVYYAQWNNSALPTAASFNASNQELLLAPTLSNLNGRLEFLLTVGACDHFNQCDSVVVLFRVNRPPIPNPNALLTYTVVVDTEFAMSLAPFFSDVDSDPLTYTAKAPWGIVSGAVFSGVALPSSLPSSFMASENITIFAEDLLHASSSVTVEFRYHYKPNIISFDTMFVVTVPLVLLMSNYFEDPLGQPLTFTSESSVSWVNLNGANLNVDVPPLSDVSISEVVTVMASNPYGLVSYVDFLFMNEVHNIAPSPTPVVSPSPSPSSSPSPSTSPSPQPSPSPAPSPTPSPTASPSPSPSPSASPSPSVSPSPPLPKQPSCNGTTWQTALNGTVWYNAREIRRPCRQWVAPAVPAGLQTYIEMNFVLVQFSPNGTLIVTQSDGVSLGEFTCTNPPRTLLALASAVSLEYQELGMTMPHANASWTVRFETKQIEVRSNFFQTPGQATVPAAAEVKAGFNYFSVHQNNSEPLVVEVRPARLDAGFALYLGENAFPTETSYVARATTLSAAGLLQVSLNQTVAGAHYIVGVYSYTAAQSFSLIVNPPSEVIDDQSAIDARFLYLAIGVSVGGILLFVGLLLLYLRRRRGSPAAPSNLQRQTSTRQSTRQFVELHERSASVSSDEYADVGSEDNPAVAIIAWEDSPAPEKARADAAVRAEARKAQLEAKMAHPSRATAIAMARRGDTAKLYTMEDVDDPYSPRPDPLTLDQKSPDVPNMSMDLVVPQAKRIQQQPPAVYVLPKGAEDNELARLALPRSPAPLSSPRRSPRRPSSINQRTPSPNVANIIADEQSMRRPTFGSSVNTPSSAFDLYSKYIGSEPDVVDDIRPRYSKSSDDSAHSIMEAVRIAKTMQMTFVPAESRRISIEEKRIVNAPPELIIIDGGIPSSPLLPVPPKSTAEPMSYLSSVNSSPTFTSHPAQSSLQTPLSLSAVTMTRSSSPLPAMMLSPAVSVRRQLNYQPSATGTASAAVDPPSAQAALWSSALSSDSPSRGRTPDSGRMSAQLPDFDTTVDRRSSFSRLLNADSNAPAQRRRSAASAPAEESPRRQIISPPRVEQTMTAVYSSHYPRRTSRRPMQRRTTTEFGASDPA